MINKKIGEFKGISSKFELDENYIYCEDRNRRIYKTIPLEEYSNIYISKFSWISNGAHLSDINGDIFSIPVYTFQEGLLSQFKLDIEKAIKNKRNNGLLASVQIIKEFHELLALGIITEEEYNKKKAEILNDKQK